ncbi:MAG TPA: hypothetical protein VLL28_00950, partial [Hyphomicrobiaceae bacterium]|nr:hypothetical protein [Hyphomicrobiaceae bacterium]
ALVAKSTVAPSDRQLARAAPHGATPSPSVVLAALSGLNDGNSPLGPTNGLVCIDRIGQGR